MKLLFILTFVGSLVFGGVSCTVARKNKKEYETKISTLAARNTDLESAVEEKEVVIGSFKEKFDQVTLVTEGLTKKNIQLQADQEALRKQNDQILESIRRIEAICQEIQAP
jgi:chromosome segregation ATPase